MIRNRPNYGIYPLALTNANTQPLTIEGTRIGMIGAFNGTTPVAAVVNVQIGKALGDAIPFTTGTEVVCENKFEALQLSWTAQAGVVAYFIISDDADGNGVHVTAPPTVTAGNLTITQGGNAALVSASGQLETVLFNSNGANSLGISSDATALVRQRGGPLTSPSTLTNPALNSLPQSASATQPQVQPGTIGGSFFNANVTASASTTVLAAASNVNGVVVRGCFLTGASGVGLFTGTTAPTSLTSNQAVHVTVGASVPLPREIFLPAGQGLWVWCGATAEQVAVNYDIL
jgi:hypothetical protein